MGDFLKKAYDNEQPQGQTMSKKQSWTLILTCLMSVINTILQAIGV